MTSKFLSTSFGCRARIPFFAVHSHGHTLSLREFVVFRTRTLLTLEFLKCLVYNDFFMHTSSNLVTLFPCHALAIHDVVFHVSTRRVRDGGFQAACHTSRWRKHCETRLRLGEVL